MLLEKLPHKNNHILMDEYCANRKRSRAPSLLHSHDIDKFIQ